jgi:zinc carboxypeptidase
VRSDRHTGGLRSLDLRALAVRSPIIPGPRYRVLVAAFLLAGGATTAHALYDPAKEYVETPAVAARYPDPPIDIPTPAFKLGRTDFTTHEELIAFIDGLAARSAELRVRILGQSQEQRAIPLLIFARPAVADGGELAKNGKPTVLMIGQQHGNEPAGGEAALALAAELSADPGARLLDHVNVLIVPRANPDGAYHFVRGLKNGADVNRDHLLLGTPEGRALAWVFVQYQPDVVLDCHEFGVKLRWFEKFQSLQKYDALIQYATVSNLPPAITEASEQMFRQPLLRAFADAGLSQSWYYTSSYDMNDRTVSMGGVVPDTGRNIAGLRNAVSFLLETRGVGIGRAHYKRRVYTHLTAIHSILASTTRNAPALLALGRQVRQEVANTAGQGELVVSGAAASTRHTLDFIDPQTGNDRRIEVDWRSALEIQPRLKRSRPTGYLLPASEIRAARRLRDLGATVLQLAEDESIAAERYRLTRADESRKDDVRRNDEDAPTSVVRIATAVERAVVAARRGDFYVPLDQALANVIAAALEPETQSSYAANRLFNLPRLDAGQAAFLPLYRVPARPKAAALVWDGSAP